MMMRNLIFLLVLILQVPAMAQQRDSTAQKYFNDGLRYYQEGKLTEALNIWTDIVNNKIGRKSDIYGVCFFNIPTIYWEQGKFDKAKEWYKKVLASDLKDNEETGDLMEPHTNYKHKSAIALAGLYEQDSNFKEVLNWFCKADTQYRYWGFEGSATNVSQEQAFLLEGKVKSLLKLNKKNEAIREIITELICAGPLDNFFSKAQGKLLTLIDRSFKADFNKAIEQVVITQVNPSNWSASFTVRGLKYTIPMTSVQHDQKIPHYWREVKVNSGQVVDAKYLLAEIKSGTFYTLL